ncbi:lipopolysaccharide assembly protein LapA domain-containing protein [Breoghania sp.]|uniref:lipopolysaccharide assembly protein LapA domain-containing protein n=1 Tax=Breoghania sp. TaxID=2065378 RepID=UPI002602CB98|nr:lipopolysaccharide assembly protein LapA domain-containing protein [Breoghania sp.]MDJ0931018.1 lipopolysaccharide assembly protein LapA domain-containing protein [Breoghania sp.]
MLRRIAKTILLLPVIIFAVLVILLAVANRHETMLSLDPLSPGQPAFSISVPLFWLLFGALGIGIVLGGIGAWAKQGKWRKQARYKRREADTLRHEADRLKEEVQAANPRHPGLPAAGNKRAACHVSPARPSAAAP